VEVDYSKGRAEISGGILKKIADAITGELSLKPEIILLPQKRVGPDLIAGEISIVCFVHESWFPPEFTKQVLWSDELTTNTNLIATLKGKPINKIEDLFGKQVGVIVNYYYKKLDPYFESGKILKETAPSTASNIQKLLHDRIEYMIISNLEFDYYKKTNPELRSYDLGMDTVKVKCALSKKAGIKLSELNKAITALK
jgi:polar amino acid transport system substrate-binding protein